MTRASASLRSTSGVLIVDDSAFMRRLISEMIAAVDGFHVAGTARDGADALAQIARLDPDILTLDLEMPRLDGLEVLRRVMREAPRPVVVLSAGGEQYGDATLRALELGAIDFVRKPSGPVSLDLHVIRERLVAALHAAARTRIAPLTAPRMSRASGSLEGVPLDSVSRAPTEPRAAHRIVVMASSTGGPRALAEVVPALPGDLPAAVVIAQHLPREFAAALADRLDRASRIRVRVAGDGDPLYENTVYIAPGGANTVVAGVAGAAALASVPAIGTSPATPSADALFASAAEVFGADCTGVVLTGMGRDGASGLARIRTVHGHALVQDEASSAIYGMPRAAFAEAGADAVLALGAIAAGIVGAVCREGREWLTA